MKRFLPAVVLLACFSCEHFEPAAPDESSILDGPVEGLTTAEILHFQQGDIAFNDDIFTTKNGLGPLFVATSCGSCHAGDGKGHPFTTLTRFGQSDPSGNNFLSQGGPQLQHLAIPGYQPETIPAGATFSKFLPPANTGLGFLDAVPDADLLALADPNDANGDGISGIPNWVSLKSYVTPRPNSIPLGGKYIGRFGRKGSTYDLLQQTAQAYNQDIGITSTHEPHDTYSGLPIDPEVSNVTVDNVVFYLKTLKAPIQRETTDAMLGKTIFATIKCNACHTEQLKTGSSPIAALSNKVFHPYTDLLLHDMGPGLNDGYTEGSATAAEWRTPPLWGLGLSKNSQGGTYFLMHDGRANSIESAILLHGGEATGSLNSYKALPDQEKKQLIQFLESL
ncbi:MAG TPA: di-heme oxidoredictase family protein [Cyclobacteriaceae bacterium]|nr:di-heme oxidoredictase family protein [Cyclobacteriaceae bacterium]